MKKTKRQIRVKKALHHLGDASTGNSWARKQASKIKNRRHKRGGYRRFSQLFK